ncbi:hypothetical protein M9827_27615, partial [Pseudomonas sp. AKS31]|nr:hypothetical protein [Pseudomonas sp. AKS31]
MTHTRDYRPVFSGKGYNGATVSFYHPGGDLKAAPDAVVSGGTWSSTAYEEWGPVKDREVHIQQCTEEHCSLNRVVLKVSIAPLPPTVDEPPREDLTPTFRGTCLEGVRTQWSSLPLVGTVRFYRCPGIRVFCKNKTYRPKAPAKGARSCQRI